MGLPPIPKAIKQPVCRTWSMLLLVVHQLGLDSPSRFQVVGKWQPKRAERLEPRLTQPPTAGTSSTFSYSAPRNKKHHKTILMMIVCNPVTFSENRCEDVTTTHTFKFPPEEREACERLKARFRADKACG